MPPSRESFDAVERRVRQAMDVGLTDMAHRYVLAMIEELLLALAERNRLKVGNAPLGRLIRDLAVRGLLARDDFETIRRARDVRTWPNESDGRPTPAEIEILLALGHRLREEITAATADDALGVD